MDKKVLLLDMDGLIVLKTEVFSLRLSKKLNIPWDDVLAFIYNEFQDCLVGKADLKKTLKKYVKGWGWEGSIDELLDFWFDGEKEIDTEVLKKVDSLRKNGKMVFLATNNEKYRTEYLWKTAGLEKHFDGVFSSASIGFKKPDKEFYFKILSTLSVLPNEVIFLDDDKENVASAKEVGMDARFYPDEGWEKMPKP